MLLYEGKELLLTHHTRVDILFVHSLQHFRMSRQYQAYGSYN